MISVKGTYNNGIVKLKEKIPYKGSKEVIVTFLEAEEEKSNNKKFDINSLSFKKTQKILKNLKSSLSEEIIKERRSYI